MIDLIASGRDLIVQLISLMVIKWALLISMYNRDTNVYI